MLKFARAHSTRSIDMSKISGWVENCRPFPFLIFPVYILYKSIAGRYLPVRVADGPIIARYRFTKNASWVVACLFHTSDAHVMTQFTSKLLQHGRVFKELTAVLTMPTNGGDGTGSQCCSCARMSVYFAASMAILVLAAVAFFISLISTNWSASGQELKMGLWDFCIHPKQNGSWSCFPSNTG